MLKEPLSSADYYFARPDLFAPEMVLQFGSRLDEEKLRDALARVVSTFPLLGARLTQEPEKSLCFSWGPDARVPLEVHRLERVPERENLEGWKALVPRLSTRLEAPLLRVALHQGAESSSLALSMSHALGDGFSFFWVWTSWARACAGASIEAPSRSRRPLRGTAHMKRPADEETIFQATTYLLGESQPRKEGLETSILDVPKEELNAFTREASGRGLQLSAHDFICARLLKTLEPYALGVSPSERWLRFPVDYRRSFPGLPPDYFGNAVRDALVRVGAQEVRELSMCELAARARSAGVQVDVSAVQASLDCFEALRRTDLELFSRLQYPGILVSNLSRLPFHQLDFGKGPPTGIVCLPEVAPFAAVLPSERGFTAHLSLPRATISAAQR